MKKMIFTALALSLVACHSQKNTTKNTENKQVMQNQVWDKAYGGADKSYDTNLLKLREEIAPKFQVFEYQDPNGTKIKYNLFIPKNLDNSKKYPLVMFIADASTAGKGTLAPLMQGYGGIIWATDESQAKNPAFVLVPAYDEKAVDDNWNTTDQVKITPNLVREIIKSYPIDNQRVYTTGQSMGGMISFYLNSIDPELFTASMFVGSQWDIAVLEPLTKAKFLYVVSAGDPKASKGMAQVIDLMQKNNVPYAEGEFSAKLTQNTQNQEVSKILNEGKSVNFIRFESGSMLPEGSTMKAGDHMYSFDYAYLLEPARDWLFEQQKNKKSAMTPENEVLEKAVAFYQKKDYKNAFSAFEQADKLGHFKANRYLGLMFLNGEGVAKNPTKAFEYFKSSAEKGDITGQYWTGYCYENGIGTQKDLEQAVSWYKKSAERGDKISQPAIDALKRLGRSVGSTDRQL